MRQTTGRRPDSCDAGSLQQGLRNVYLARAWGMLFAMTTIVTPPTGPWTAAPTATSTSGTTSRAPAMSPRKRHIVSILLQNEVGALTRVASLFATRGYNIESLNVAPTEDPTVSRLTLVTTGTEAVVQQIVNQSLKLIDVVNVDDVTRDQHVERELLLLKMRVAGSQIGNVNSAVQKAGGKVLSDDTESYTVELTDSEAQINRFIAEAGNLGEVLEVVRSGALAMLRGATTLRA
jgi:acetolactate synthase-1/3 small subunit